MNSMETSRLGSHETHDLHGLGFHLPHHVFIVWIQRIQKESNIKDFMECTSNTSFYAWKSKKLFLGVLNPMHDQVEHYNGLF